MIIKVRGKIKYIVILFLFTLFINFNLNLVLFKGHKNYEKIYIHTQSENHYTEQWIKDPSFDSPLEFWNIDIEGDTSDVNTTLDQSEANMHVLGERRLFTIIADPPSSSNWTEIDNPEFPNRPQVSNITTEGCFVSHTFADQTAIQNPSVHWDNNLSISQDMSDYLITSASVKAVVYANVSTDIDREDDTEARDDGFYSMDQYALGDYIKFYVLVSDIEKSKVYEIASYFTNDLGEGNPPGVDLLTDTYMVSVPEEALIFYLSSVISSDNHNFTLTLGIRLNTEDNVADYYDIDTFHEIIIKYVNLSFTYEKKIDRFTSISWNQIGNKVNDLSEYEIEINAAILNFKYKINNDWPSLLSPNSEIRILINDIKIIESIKLIDTTFSTIFLDAKAGGFNIRSLISKGDNISISIQLYLADDFILDQLISLSIDDVFLEISYTELIPDQDNSMFLIWLVILALLVVIGILGSLSIRSYVYLPRKQKKKLYLMLRTQKFKDIENIHAILLIHRTSGLPIFTHSYSDLMKGKKTLFSGFIQAITVIGEEISHKEPDEYETIKFSDKLDFHKIVELDLKAFFCLILDVEELRTVLILKSKSSKRLKQIMFNFTFALYLKISNNLKDFDNDLSYYKKEVPPFLNTFFELNYKHQFKINYQYSDLQKVKSKFRLNKILVKILNTIFTILNGKSSFKLMDIIEQFNQKNEDLIIDALESLIEQEIIIPIDSIIR